MPARVAGNRVAGPLKMVWIVSDGVVAGSEVDARLACQGTQRESGDATVCACCTTSRVLVVDSSSSGVVIHAGSEDLKLTRSRTHGAPVGPAIAAAPRISASL